MKMHGISKKRDKGCRLDARIDNRVQQTAPKGEQKGVIVNFRLQQSSRE